MDFDKSSEERADEKYSRNDERWEKCYEREVQKD